MDKYQAAMILSAAGDAIGYKNNEWKRNKNGVNIFQELQGLGGLESLEVEESTWPVSASTVMHIATAHALANQEDLKDKDNLFNEMASNYKDACEEASHRSPDPAYEVGCASLHPGKVFGWHIPFNPRGTGFGAASKAMCLGLVYHSPNNLKSLVTIATECGRMTHNHPLGFTGSICTALFSSYILQSRPITSWGRDMLKSLNLAKAYCKKSIRNNLEYNQHWVYFESKWETYLKERDIAAEGNDNPRFPSNYDVEIRDKVFRFWSSDGRAGSRGHDAPMIAYDALLMAQQSKSGTIWENVCHHAMIHGGDCDATGCIAGFWYGLMYGMEGVSVGVQQQVEFRDELEELGQKLYKIAN